MPIQVERYDFPDGAKQALLDIMVRVGAEIREKTEMPIPESAKLAAQMMNMFLESVIEGMEEGEKPPSIN